MRRGTPSKVARFLKWNLSKFYCWLVGVAGWMCYDDFGILIFLCFHFILVLLFVVGPIRAIPSSGAQPKWSIFYFYGESFWLFSRSLSIRQQLFVVCAKTVLDGGGGLGIGRRRRRGMVGCGTMNSCNYILWHALADAEPQHSFMSFNPFW